MSQAKVRSQNLYSITAYMYVFTLSEWVVKDFNVYIKSKASFYSKYMNENRSDIINYFY